MRAVSGPRIALRSTGNLTRRNYGWLQAGISSFAYRSAHLVVPRLLASASLVLTFYLV